MTPVCIFTYAGDALPLRPCVASVLGAGGVPVVCDDAADPLPRATVGWLDEVGAEYRLTDFPRRGNLNGTDCAAGIARELSRAARRHGSGWAVKLDTDTVLYDLGPWAGTVVATSTRQCRRLAFGSCYSLWEGAASRVADRLDRLPLDERAPEDLTIWGAVLELGELGELHDHDPDGGLWTAAPLGVSAEECRRWAAVTFGNVPERGWRDRGIELFTAMETALKSSGNDQRPERLNRANLSLVCKD